MKPLVSIVTPLYNASLYLKETISSVLNQTCADWEWIVVDDFSSDDSFSIIKDAANTDKRIKLIKLEKNCGSAYARNKALDIAQGKYVTFLDADDMLRPEYLEKQLAFIKNHGPIITASYSRLKHGKETNFIVPKETTYKSILKGNPLSCLTTMYDRSIFPNERFSEDMQRHEDYFFWIGILKQGHVAYGNEEVLAVYRLSNDSKNSSKIKLLKPLYRLYHKKLHIIFLKSFIMVLNYVLYSKKKYKGVK